MSANKTTLTDVPVCRPAYEVIDIRGLQEASSTKIIRTDGKDSLHVKEENEEDEELSGRDYGQD